MRFAFPHAVPNRYANLLLARLCDAELRQLAPHLAPVTLNKGETLRAPRGAGDHVYFVEAGVVCSVASLSDRESVTVAITGREGLVGALAILGTPPPFRHRLLVLIPGSAFSVSAALLRSRPQSFPAILDLAGGYAQVLMAEIAQSAVCNRYHLGRERLARWLLMTADCAEASRLPLTHEAITGMVGGARTLVTAALGELRERGAIDYRRGKVTVKRRPLAREACECYGTIRQVVGRYVAS